MISSFFSRSSSKSQNHVRLSERASKVLNNHKMASMIVHAIIDQNHKLVNGETILVKNADGEEQDINLTLVTTKEELNTK